MDDVQYNPLESTIRRILSERVGRENAISRKALVEEINRDAIFQKSEREIRTEIKHLVESHGEWIGSCARGYFVIRTNQELVDACRYYHGYALSLLRVEAKLKKISMPALMGQMALELTSNQSSVNGNQ